MIDIDGNGALSINETRQIAFVIFYMLKNFNFFKLYFTYNFLI